MFRFLQVLFHFAPLSVSDLTISAGFGCFVGGGCRLPDGQGMEPGAPAAAAGRRLSAVRPGT